MIGFGWSTCGTLIKAALFYVKFVILNKNWKEEYKMIFNEHKVKLAKGKTLFIVPFGEIQSEEEYPRL